MVKDAGGGRETLEGKEGRGATDGGFAVVGVETEGSGRVEIGEGVLTELELSLCAVGEEDGGNGGVAGGAFVGMIVLSGRRGGDSGRESLRPGSDSFGVHAFLVLVGVGSGGVEGWGWGVRERKGSEENCCVWSGYWLIFQFAWTLRVRKA